ncbi:MAG: hypothetical protein ABR956_10235 [Terracidiphilus sp.]|jgi:hypothetical protein
MKSILKAHVPISFVRESIAIARTAVDGLTALIALIVLAVLASLLPGVPLLRAQAPSRFVGTVTAISGISVTVKTDAGDVRQFDVPSTAAIKRISPGQKDLSAADTLQFSDLETGDRVLVKLDPATPGPPAQAVQIVAVKQADLVKKQQEERADWQRRGVGGLVKSVDGAAGVITLTSGSGATAKTITVHTTNATVLKRYAPASVRFDEARPAPIDAIHPGDQLRARGAKNEAGTEITAEEVVSGTFRNITGIIVSLDTASSTLVVKDLATKKQVTIHITPDAQMRRLPDRMAQFLAARLKGSYGGAGGRPGGAQPSTGAPASAPRGAYGQGGGGGQGFSQAGSSGGGDPQQMLSRAPTIQLADLKKGDAIMVVSTDGATDVTAITLVAGVEPLLEAPAASQSLLNNWSMGSGAPEGPE